MWRLYELSSGTGESDKHNRKVKTFRSETGYSLSKSDKHDKKKVTVTRVRDTVKSFRLVSPSSSLLTLSLSLPPSSWLTSAGCEGLKKYRMSFSRDAQQILQFK